MRGSQLNRVEAEVVAVVPNWNGRDLLEVALRSLAAQRGVELATVVVDNGSEDDSLSYLASDWPDVTVVALPENAGYAAAVNRGVQTSEGEFVATINSDVRLEPDWANTLVAALRAAPSAASATGKVFDAGRRCYLDGTGDIVSWDGYCVRRGRGNRDVGQYNHAEQIFSANGGASLYRRAAFDAVGYFDESFFLYVEDVDWGFRAQLAGYDCLYDPGAVAHHLGGATSGRVRDLEHYCVHRNLLTMMLKNYPARALLSFWPLAVLRRIGSLAKAIHARRGKVVIRAWCAAARRLPRTLKERRQIQAHRVRDYRELSALVPVRAPVTRPWSQ